MTPLEIKDLKDIPRLTIGRGQIGPEGAVHGAIDPEQLPELVAELESGMYSVPIDRENRPNAAGGTFTIVVGMSLSSAYPHRAGMKIDEYSKVVYGRLRQLEQDNPELYRIMMSVCIDGRLPGGEIANPAIFGGHRDSHAHGPNCGCGAEDKFKDAEDEEGKLLALGILGMMAVDPDFANELRETARVLGFEVSDKTHASVIAKAMLLYKDKFAVSGKQISDAMIESAEAVGADKDQAVPVLVDDHTEAIVALVGDKESTVSRRKVAAKWGKDYGVFVVNTGLFGDVADTLAINEDEAAEILTGMVYFNLAAASLLGHESLLLAMVRARAEV